MVCLPMVRVITHTIGRVLFQLAAWRLGGVAREDGMGLALLLERRFNQRELSARCFDRELDRRALADEFLGRANGNGRPRLAPGHVVGDARGKDGKNEEREKGPDEKTHWGSYRSASRLRGRPAIRIALLIIEDSPLVPVSSRGQDGWFSAIKPGFESPYRLHKGW